MELDLGGRWKVSHVEYGQEIKEILAEDFVPEGWLTAQVPEDIHATLRREGFIRGHVYNKEPGEEAWIEERDWVYYREFYLPVVPEAERTELFCEGLDTFCEVFLNGCFLGQGQNMFLSFRAQADGLLQQGRNVLVIRFFSPVRYVEKMDQEGIFSITTSDRILARKAQMNYGWDFCGRTVTLGIWKRIGLRFENEIGIGSYYLYTDRLCEKKAILGLEVQLCGMECANPAAEEETFCKMEDYSLEVCLLRQGQEIFSEKHTCKEKTSLSFSVESPQLWWPRPYGGQPLYDFILRLKKGEQVLEEKRQRFGIRTVEVLQERQPDGQSFQFVVNGKRIFMRGANWVPIKMIYTDIGKKDYEVYLKYAEAGNISMLRIWGGGIYEDPCMYELCDEKGILIWNDFMFSCGIYPQDEKFLENVRREAEEVIRRYRNYTCLAIWSGDNENGQAYGWAGRPYEFREDLIGNQVLQQACSSLDPHRYYIPTSPCSPDENGKGGDNPSSPYQGDQHIYIMSANPGVKAYRDYGKNYYKRILGFRPRFMSEFGFISLPEKDTFYRFNFLREPLRYPEEMTEFLPSCKKYLEKGEADRVIYYSQLFNAMALKYWIEYFRSLKGTCWGCLYWKFNDPLADCAVGGIFPSHMAAVDMYQNPKMTYYFTRRAYADFLVACVEKDGGLDIVACSELEEEKRGILTVSRMDFSGHIFWQTRTECCAEADQAKVLHSVRGKDWKPARKPDEESSGKPDDRQNQYLKIEFSTEHEVYENRYYFLDLNENDCLKLPESGLAVSRVRQEGRCIFLQLRTENFARCVRLNILDLQADYSDNYFDMDAGSEREIVIILRKEALLTGVEGRTVYVEAENRRRFPAAWVMPDGENSRNI